MTPDDPLAGQLESPSLPGVDPAPAAGPADMPAAPQAGRTHRRFAPRSGAARSAAAPQALRGASRARGRDRPRAAAELDPEREASWPKLELPYFFAWLWRLSPSQWVISADVFALGWSLMLLLFSWMLTTSRSERLAALLFPVLPLLLASLLALYTATRRRWAGTAHLLLCLLLLAHTLMFPLGLSWLPLVVLLRQLLSPAVRRFLSRRQAAAPPVPADPQPPVS